MNNGFTYESTNFDTYHKFINTYTFYVYKHKQEKSWKCSISSPDHDNVIINYDCTLEWIMSLLKILENV